MQQINESILNDEIREHLKENRISHMEYLPGMERISSDLLEQVTSRMDAYDPPGIPPGMCAGPWFRKPHAGGFRRAALAAAALSGGDGA